MRILAVDSSTRHFSLAISQEGKVLRSKTLVLDKILSSSIIPAINNLLKSAKLGIKDIDGLAVGIGPGSFTSLRVGLATVKGLAVALNKPVVGIPSLDILARTVSKVSAPTICPVMDARRQLVYAGMYDNTGPKRALRGNYRLTGISDLLKELKGEVFFIGDGVEVYKKDIRARKSIKAVFADEKFWHPSAKVLTALAMERFQQGQTDDADQLVPLYLYAEDCQVRR